MSKESYRTNNRPPLPKMPVLNVDKKTPYVRSKENHLAVAPLILEKDIPTEEKIYMERSQIGSRGKTPSSRDAQSAAYKSRQGKRPIFSNNQASAIDGGNGTISPVSTI